MRKQLQGIVFVLFGMLLVLIGVVNRNWVPMMAWEIGGVFSFILLWLGLAMGIVGLVFSLSKDNGSK